MKVVVNGIEIEINGSSKLYYDVAADTLSVDPVDVPRRESNAPKRTYTKREKTDGDLFSKISSASMTKDELKAKIIDFISLQKGPTAGQYITMHCLGKGAKQSKQKYLTLLLHKMVEDNELVQTIENNRKRYAMP